MPLEMIEVRELRPFLVGFLNGAVETGATLGTRDETLGWIWDNGMGWGRDGNWSEAGYYQLADQLIYFAKLIVRTSLTQYNPGLIIMDAQGIDSAAGHFKDNYVPPKAVPQASNVGKFYMGQWRLEAGSQRVYSFGNMSIASGWFEYDPNTLDYGGVPIYPNFDPEASVETVGNDGYYLSVNYSTNTLGRVPMGMVFFEGMTNSAAYSEITDGPSSVHPLGLALIRADSALRLSGVDIGNAWAWIDVSTGNAVGFLDIPYDTRGESAQQSEPNLDGNGFDWSRIDFHPDPDSLDAQPKGELHIYSARQSNQVFPASGAFVGGDPFDGFRVYVTTYDFNPFGLTSGVVRQHNRRTFLAAIDIPDTPGVPNGFDLGDATHPGSSAIFYHKPSNSYFLWTGYGPINPVNDGLPEPAFYPEVDGVALLRWKRAFTVEELVQGTIGVVATNKTVRHVVTAFGDFSQRAPGVALSATLLRASTYEEQFTPLLATSVYVVEAAVIDDDDSIGGVLEVYEGDVATGTLLTVGVDYSVVFATGTITGILFTPVVLHSIVYRHRSNPLSPPHGTLLNATATTNSNGSANFDVVYPDDPTLEDMLDQLTVTD